MELIVYATPTGALAEACRTFWDAIDAARPTEAQRFPPHCTVTGFFHRLTSRLPAILDDLERAVHLVDGEPSIQVVGMHATGDWIGLELRSAWLIDVSARLREVHAPHPGEDAVRLKTRPHLSLAYGRGFDRSLHQPLAREHLREIPPGGWELGLWERTSADGWHQHSRRTIAPPGPTR